MDHIKTRRQYFGYYLPPLKVGWPQSGIECLPNTCPSCGYPTLEERTSWEICGICFWEDDGQDDHNADEVCGGPNGGYSLTQHRIEWGEYLEEMKNSKSEFVSWLLKIDDLISLNDKSHTPAILSLVEKVKKWFDEAREI